MQKEKHYSKHKDGILLSYIIEDVNGRICTKCNKLLPKESYTVRTTGEDKQGVKRYYLSSMCKTCSPKATRLWRNGSFTARQISNLKYREKDIGISNQLFPEAPELCPVLGIELDYSYSKRHEGRASVDRIDNTKGYVIDNVMVTSWRANRLKNNMTLQELWLFSTFWKKWIEENRPEILEGIDN